MYMRKKKLLFFYYKSYYDASSKLTDENFLIFNDTLIKCHFSKEDTIESVNSVVFNDKELCDAWEVVKKQIKKHDRSSKNYRIWKNSVLKRDKKICKKCGSYKFIEVHHIVRWVDDIDLRYDINNGISLCKKCHKKEHGRKI